MNPSILAGVAAFSIANGLVAVSDPPRTVAAADDPSWPYEYWDIYGLISDGSMWNSEAFLAQDWRTRSAERQAALARARAGAETVEVVEPLEKEASIFIAPTLLAACDLYRPEAHFEIDSADLQEADSETLDKLGECLQEPPLDDKLLSIEGHTDPTGTAEHNLELGLDRAESVAEALEKRGVAADRIDTYSRGEGMADEDPEMWPENRRVVIDLDE